MRPGSVNPDGFVHANVNCLGNQQAFVGFEDLDGGGDRDYDDVAFLIISGN
jgi:hypothetical protein